ncbi:hypothetical protein PGTUg99_014692 [Puccinia graminis f. sp. tritici]|uniref:Uncharacterized protein n=1 Tax=Puccinia graminis f. sp. tritici TaxID=56615 RepID=A0A5B0SKT2_PUCGR|nr:hypothetical protein PGTUg99_014692 [Puccinia graminis f. sp. tritici]
MPEGRLETEVLALGVGLLGLPPGVSGPAESIAANPPNPRRLARLWGPIESATP